MPLSSRFLEVLRTTLRRVEAQAGLKPDDPALLELKRSIVCNVATMETAAPGNVDGEDGYDSGLAKSA